MNLQTISQKRKTFAQEILTEGELALDLGQTENWVQQALGHAVDSKITRRYMRVREGTMLDVFDKIAKRA